MSRNSDAFFLAGVWLVSGGESFGVMTDLGNTAGFGIQCGSPWLPAARATPQRASGQVGDPVTAEHPGIVFAGTALSSSELASFTKGGCHDSDRTHSELHE